MYNINNAITRTIVCSVLLFYSSSNNNNNRVTAFSVHSVPPLRRTPRRTTTTTTKELQQQQQQQQLTRGGALLAQSKKETNVKKVVNGKQLYLVTDEGFITKFVINMVGLTFGFACLRSIPSLRQYGTQLITNHLLTTNNVWWFGLGLASSSCCAIQLILNALSVGCAGFNTILGPIRPTLLSGTLLMQIAFWYTGTTTLFRSKLQSSLLVGILSLLPELLTIWTKVRSPASVSTTNNKEYAIALEMGKSVGCAACVTTVKGILDNIQTVVNYNVSMETGTLQLNLTNDTDLATILKTLDAGGYPMKLLDAT